MTNLIVEKSSNVGSWKSIRRTCPGNNIDAPISTYVIGGNRYWIIPSVELKGPPFDYTVWHSITSGPLDRPLKVLWKAEHYVIGNTPTGRYWITNVYQHHDGLLAFVHVELAVEGDTPANNPGHTRIGLAWSPSKVVPQWNYLGHILEPHGDPSPFNIHGTPYVIGCVEGVPHFMAYFHESNNGIGVASSPVAEVLHAAKKGLTTPWKKYRNGRWVNEGAASKLGLWPIVAHSDAAYSLVTRKYYFCGWMPSAFDNHSGVDGSEIRFFESTDGLDWDQIGTIGKIPLQDRQYQYISMVDADGGDNGVIGDRFYLYAVWRHDNPRNYLLNRFSLKLEE